MVNVKMIVAAGFVSVTGTVLILRATNWTQVGDSINYTCSDLSWSALLVIGILPSNYPRLPSEMGGDC